MTKTKSEAVCVATFVAKDGKGSELQKALYVLIEPTRKEAGCLRYELNQNLENPDEFTMIEKFKDLDSFYFHGNQPYSTNFKTIAPELADSISVKLYKEFE
jgi:quinol monooxygenase YgiN